MSTVHVRRFDANLLAHSVPWLGQVEAVFDTAAVVRPLIPGPRLTLMAPYRSLVPWGLGFAWTRADELFEGCQVALRGARVMVGLKDGQVRLLLSGRGVSLSLGRLVGPASRQILADQYAALGLSPRVCALMGEGVYPAAGPLARALAERVADPLATLGAALAFGRSDEGAYAPAVGALAGLGTGSTPTGDDLLVGLLAAADRFALLGWVNDGALAALREAVNAVPRAATTPVAREMLAHAVGGTYPEALVELARLLGREGVNNHDWGQAVAWLQDVGSESGTDMLTGVLCLVRAVGAR